MCFLHCSFLFRICHVLAWVLLVDAMLVPLSWGVNAHMITCPNARGTSVLTVISVHWRNIESQVPSRMQGKLDFLVVHILPDEKDVPHDNPLHTICKTTPLQVSLVLYRNPVESYMKKGIMTLTLCRTYEYYQYKISWWLPVICSLLQWQRMSMILVRHRYCWENWRSWENSWEFSQLLWWLLVIFSAQHKKYSYTNKFILQLLHPPWPVVIMVLLP